MASRNEANTHCDRPFRCFAAPPPCRCRRASDASAAASRAPRRDVSFTSRRRAAGCTAATLCFRMITDEIGIASRLATKAITISRYLQRFLFSTAATQPIMLQPRATPPFPFYTAACHRFQPRIIEQYRHAEQVRAIVKRVSRNVSHNAYGLAENFSLPRLPDRLLLQI